MDSVKRKQVLKLIIIVIVVVFIVDWLARSLTKDKIITPPPPTVIVQKPDLKPMTEYVTQTGTVVAYNSVNLVARVQGYLQAIKFTDGTLVKKDDLLFIIEPEPYLEQLKSAQATVEARKAAYAYDLSEYQRQKRMYKQNATSLNSVEKWEAKVEETKAQIDKAEADVVNAKINYGYTHVLAPFDGRIGRHLVDVGNLVGHGEATELATIEQISPIYVYFNLNELDVIKLRQAARAAGFKPSEINTIPAYVQMQGETGFPHEGKLDYVSTGLNASTGTLEFRALLANKDFTLLPGLFVTVRIPISKPKPELTVPDTAILYDQIGPYLLTVNSNQEVVQKRVQTGAKEQGMHAIIKGLDSNDEVIVSGLQFATPGNKVTPKTEKQ
ncbi:efflux RND transporter periplasmic adaptor subunit [Legionella impletisoli]|uniref:MexE family multidrug efflux RND transporter periplasmic adaptor subunit n=1 Tax=Legionella impletisoli TaxID=343510 RepID=A0A917N813_9GAMM|nr:efflux RND transporter periplasmic adaptor subunit [Legionella impletisoli]GGI76420.1 MexE family multidrug efflux RND transporter periplasmic adaptor subunit [Legionella impletisoli]